MKITLADDWDYPPNPFPDKKEKQGHFVGRKAEVSLLANDLIRKDSGSILISGMRGVGKTSLVYAALNEVKRLERNGGRTLLPVILNASQLQHHLKNEESEKNGSIQKSVIQALIRRLYSAVYQQKRNEIAEKDFLGDSLQNLYKKAVAKEVEISDTRKVSELEGTSETSEETNSITVAPNFRQIAAIIVAVASTILMTFGVAQTSGWSIFGGAVVAVVGAVGVTAKWEKRTKSSSQKTEGTEANANEYYLMDNDVGNLEADLEDVLLVLREKYRVVFIIDEMDKMTVGDDGAINALKLVRGFKNLFTLSPAVFVFITDQKVYEQFTADRTRREVDGTLFTHRFFIKRPDHADLEAFVRDVSRIDDVKNEQTFQQFIDYLCFAARSDFTALYESVRDHVQRFDASHCPVIVVDKLTADEKNKANAQKAIELIYDRYRFERPSGWRKNEAMLAQMYDLVVDFVETDGDADAFEPASNEENEAALGDLLRLIERHRGLTDMGLAVVQVDDEEESVTRYSWTGRIDPISDDALVEPTTLERSVLEASSRLSFLVNQVFRATYGVRYGKTLSAGSYKNAYSSLKELGGPDLADSNAEVKPILDALRARPIRHKSREQKDEALDTLKTSYDEVTAAFHRVVANAIVSDGVVVTNFNQSPNLVDAAIREMIVESGLAHLVVVRQASPQKCLVFLLESDQELLDSITAKLNTRNNILRVLDLRTATDAIKVGDKAHRRGVYSSSLNNVAAMIRRLVGLKKWLRT